jgi:ABC-2 type transport system permease protein
LAQSGVGNSGTVMALQLQRFDMPSPNKRVRPVGSKDGYVIAAQITGEPAEDDAALDSTAGRTGEVDPADVEATDPDASKDKKKEINVILVTDIDFVVPSFFTIREGGEQNILPVTQNVPFILNVVDSLTGERRFTEIRKRARIYRTLSGIDEATQASREKASNESEKISKEFEQQVEEARNTMQKKVDALRQRTDLKDLERQVQLEQTAREEQRKLDAKSESLASEQKRREKEIAFERDQEIRSVQDRYKMYASLVPPIPPLLLALAVFFRRRELERQGVSRDRLR